MSKNAATQERASLLVIAFVIALLRVRGRIVGV